VVPPRRQSAASGSLGQRAVALAKEQLGKPYVWGAESPAVGFECSGLVQYTFKQLGIDLPRVSRDQARAGRTVASLAEARPGDLIAFGSPVDHIGIYAGNNKMVVAPHSGDVVKVQEVYRTPTAIRRVL
jgi:peptidoglycan DL-endopeptidase CwlO